MMYIFIYWLKIKNVLLNYHQLCLLSHTEKIDISGIQI